MQPHIHNPIKWSMLLLDQVSYDKLLLILGQLSHEVPVEIIFNKKREEA